MMIKSDTGDFVLYTAHLAALAEKERDCIYKECISCNEVIEPFEAYVHKGVKPLCKKCYEERAAQKEGV